MDHFAGHTGAWIALGLMGCANLARAQAEDRPAGDVVAERPIRAAPADIYARLLDLTFHESVWPEGCTARWEHGATSVGVGASARLTYRAAMMRRRLTATVAKGVPGQSLKIEHAGRLGFSTTWTFTERDEDTLVEVHTWVDPPPSPLTNMYLNQVRPAWQSCHQGLLDNLARSMHSGR
ncbi:MAG: hypothetical protein CL927_12660 [Deltaproteobacteria bacterium]|nr:hypothetical protein [Deltaproteobacteria bacterium]HCH63983.1 hypothetical protein [Deltaproteobacteria bacterium]